MMYDFIIVGFGWAGVMVAHELIEHGYKVLIYDEDHAQAAYKHTAAIINPYDIKKQSLLPNIGIYLDSAIKYYSKIEKELHCDIVKSLPLLLLEQNKEQSLVSTSVNIDDSILSSVFNRDITIKSNLPVYSIQVATLLTAMKLSIAANATIINAKVSDTLFQKQNNTWQYEGYTANKVIFTRGAFEQENNLFNNFKFTANRGDVLKVCIPNLPMCNIYDIGFRLVPIEQQVFWLGSNHLWQYTIEPDLNFKKLAIENLNCFLATEFEILSHSVGWRPTLAGQQVVIQEHPHLKELFIFNGLGTKGFSKGPYYLQQLMKLVL